MFVPLAFLVAAAVQRRRSVLPYLMIVHGLLDTGRCLSGPYVSQLMYANPPSPSESWMQWDTVHHKMERVLRA